MGQDETASGALVFFGRHRRLLRAGVDTFAWSVAIVAASLLRFDLDLGRLDADRILVFAATAIAIQLIVGAFEGLYSGRYRYGSFEEVRALAWTVLVVAMVGSVANRFLPPERLPLSVPPIAAPIAMLLMGGFRYTWRLGLERSRRPSPETAQAALVFGAGEAGFDLITSMLHSPESPYLPVAVLDDDPEKRNLKLRGIAVVGDRTALRRAANEFDASTLIIAIPSASGALVRELSGLAVDAGLSVRVLPPVSELLGSPGVGDVRPLSEADLLGRREIETDLDAIAGYLTAKRVLVTGAGGSIGAELCRQIHRFVPASLLMLDRDESALHAVLLSIFGRALFDHDDVVVADVRDAPRLREVFEAYRPEVVFHAAALKHLPLLEQHPLEGVKTNVGGTLNVLHAAMATGVERFVNISTDKAADPVSVLGYTKRIGERLTAWAATQSQGIYLSVRFGNVLRSRGSVLTSFEAQIEAGGPVTLTDPDVTRYFMTVSEAIQLVIQAGAVGGDGEALVLDMGERVRIADVARQLIEASGRPVPIEFTGLRPGEKLHEVLLAAGEVDDRPAHPLIAHVPVPPLDPTTVWADGYDAISIAAPDLAELAYRSGAGSITSSRGRARAR